jgi:deazaflavin-dependent oxidoreductase (nitroreductase family)
MGEQVDAIEIPPRGTKGSGTPLGNALMKLAKPLLKMQVSRYRKNAGETAPKMMGLPVVLLTTVGAKSRLERTSVLGGFTDGDDAWLIVASKSGAPTHPSWFINLAKNPDKVWLEVGRRKLKAHVKSLRGAERLAALQRVAAVSPRYGRYQLETDREIPVLRLTPEP